MRIRHEFAELFGIPALPGGGKNTRLLLFRPQPYLLVNFAAIITTTKIYEKKKINK